MSGEIPFWWILIGGGAISLAYRLAPLIFGGGALAAMPGARTALDYLAAAMVGAIIAGPVFEPLLHAADLAAAVPAVLTAGSVIALAFLVSLALGGNIGFFVVASSFVALLWWS